MVLLYHMIGDIMPDPQMHYRYYRRTLEECKDNTFHFGTKPEIYIWNDL